MSTLFAAAFVDTLMRSGRFPSLDDMERQVFFYTERCDPKEEDPKPAHILRFAVDNYEEV